MACGDATKLYDVPLDSHYVRDGLARYSYYSESGVGKGPVLVELALPSGRQRVVVDWPRQPLKEVEHEVLSLDADGRRVMIWRTDGLSTELAWRCPAGGGRAEMQVTCDGDAVSCHARSETEVFCKLSLSAPLDVRMYVVVTGNAAVVKVERE